MRGGWLRHVHSVLYTQRGKESYRLPPGAKANNNQYRLYQRQICPQPVDVTILFQELPVDSPSGSPNSFRGQIIDFSREGMGILTREGIDGLKVSDYVTITLDSATRSNTSLTMPKLINFFRQVLLPVDNRFEVRYLNLHNGSHRIGLKPLSAEQLSFLDQGPDPTIQN